MFDVILVDIKCVGDYELWYGLCGCDIWIMCDIYLSWISLQYMLKDVSGCIVSEGDVCLSDIGYLYNIGLKSDSDLLCYEKCLIDDWVKWQLIVQVIVVWQVYWQVLILVDMYLQC